MDIITLALTRKAVRDAHVDHIGPPGPQGPPGKDGSVTNLIDSLESTDTQSALTARQGNVLYNMILEIKKNIEEFIENICTEDNFVLQTEDGNILAKEG